MVSNQAQGKLCHGSLFIGNKWSIAMFKKQKEEDILYLLTTNKIFLIKWVKGPEAMGGNQPHGCNLT
jgi:hypothetical protein